MNSSQKIFGYTEIINFRDICLEKQQNELPDNLFEEEHFFEIISKLNYRYPFVYFPELLKDYFGGFFTKKLNKKHHLSSGSELRHIINSILKMEHTREKSKDRSSLEENITKTKNKLLYPNLLQLSQKYSEEISLVYNYNLLRGFLISYLLESNSKSFEKNNFLTYVNSNLNLIHTLEEEDIISSMDKIVNTLKDDLGLTLR